MNDKLLHALAGAAVACLALALTGSGAVAFTATVLAGIAKELYDHHAGGTVDPWDAVATAAPGAAAWLLAAALP